MSLQSLEAKTLQNSGEICFSGILYQKSARLGSKQWHRMYVILCKGSLYIYSDYCSKQPKLVAVLAAYSKIEIHANRKKFPFWVFSMLSGSNNNNSISNLEFGTESENEMQKVIKIFTDNISQCKQNYNTMNNKSDTLWSNRRIDLPNPSTNNSNSIYSDNSFEACPSDDEFSHYDETEINYQSIDQVDSQSLPRSYVRKDSAMDDVYYNVSELSNQNTRLEKKEEDLSEYIGNYIYNLDNVIFDGTSAEAYQEIQRNSCSGAYLVRRDNGRQILTVRCNDSVLKYVLIIHQETGMIRIQNQEIWFNNLLDLINYYHNNNIPGKPDKLITPYKLQ